MSLCVGRPLVLSLAVFERPVLVVRQRMSGLLVIVISVVRTRVQAADAIAALAILGRVNSFLVYCGIDFTDVVSVYRVRMQARLLDSSLFCECVHFRRGFVERMMHPAMPLWLNHGGIRVVYVRVLHPSVLPVRQVYIFVVFIVKFIRACRV